MKIFKLRDKYKLYNLKSKPNTYIKQRNKNNVFVL